MLTSQLAMANPSAFRSPMAAPISASSLSKTNTSVNWLGRLVGETVDGGW